MKDYLFLDDERVPHDVTWNGNHRLYQYDYLWDIVRSQPQFEAYILEHGIPSVVSFDNDLGTGMGEGIFCAQWLVDQVLDGNVKWNPDATFLVHSKNGVAAKRIEGLLTPFVQYMKDRK